MKLKERLTSLRTKAAVLGSTALVAAGSAMASGSDPTTPILAEIATGKGYGIAVAVALVSAGFAIGAIYMARKKS